MNGYELARQIGSYLAAVHGLHFHVTGIYGAGVELRVYSQYEDGVYSDHQWTIHIEDGAA